MKMRTILLSSYQELDDGITQEVPIDSLENRVTQRNVTPEDFAHELQAALQEGDFVITSPGMVGLTDSGAQHYAQTLQLR